MAETNTDEDWELIKQAAGFTPLKNFARPVRRMGHVLHAVVPNVFVLIVEHDQNLNSDPAEKPYISAVLWAESDGAALRAIEMEIESDCKVELYPPDEMLLKANCITYGEIEKEATSLGPTQISASYRIAKDGAFVSSNIASPSFTFYFRSLRRRVREKPFAILYSGETPSKQFLIRKRVGIDPLESEKLKPLIDGL